MSAERASRRTRRTKETDIQVRLTLDGVGKASVQTGLPFLDHMLELVAVHGLFDLTLRAKGDIEVDQHHTVEDIGLVLGGAIDEALGDRKGLSCRWMNAWWASRSISVDGRISRTTSSRRRESWAHSIRRSFPISSSR